MMRSNTGHEKVKLREIQTLKVHLAQARVYHDICCAGVRILTSGERQRWIWVAAPSSGVFRKYFMGYSGRYRIAFHQGGFGSIRYLQREREIYFKSHISLWEHSSHFRLIGMGVPSVSVVSQLMYKFLCLASPKENPQVPM